MRLIDHLAASKEEASTIVLDFDGVMVASNFRRGIIGEPLPEGAELAKSLSALGFRIIFMTANPSPDTVGQWLVKHGIPFVAVTSQKMPAFAYVDDRGVQFKKGSSVAGTIQKIMELANAT